MYNHNHPMPRSPALVATEQPFVSGVQVFIPAALNRPTHTLYSICMVVQPTAQEWTVNRRYSQFLQLKKDLLVTLAQKARCPGCASFHIALSKFRFPPKALLRTNAVVRKRVTALQDFLKLVVERTFNDLPKCAICGDDVQHMLRPFLIRGAQPIGPSIVSKIQQSLSLRSFAFVPRTIPGPATADAIAALRAKRKIKALDASSSSHKQTRRSSDDSSMGFNSSSSSNDTVSSHADDSYTQSQQSQTYQQTQQTQTRDSDPIMELSTASPQPSDVDDDDDEYDSDGDDIYAKRYGVERCTDSKVPLDEAMKNVVLPKGVSATYEEVILRLSSMWDAYEDSAAALASLSPTRRRSQRLSRESSDEVTL